MVGKLIRFELKKQLSDPFFVIALCLLIVINILLTCGIREYTDEKKDYEESSGQEFPWDFWEYRGGFMDGILSSVKNTRECYAMITAEGEDFAAAIAKKYGQEVLDINGAQSEEMYKTPGYFGENWNDATMVTAYQNVQTWNKELDVALRKVVAAAKDYGREALEDKDNYGIRRNKDIIKLYTVPRGEITSPIKGWVTFLFDSPTMLFVFLLVLLACGGSFSRERERQTVFLLHTSKNGKGRTLAAKYLSGVLVAAGLTVLLQTVTLASVWFKEGLLGLNQPAAAMAQLTLLSWPMSVGGYVVVHLVCQILTAALLSVLINTISALSKTSVISYVAGVLVLGLLLVAQSAKTQLLMGPLSLADPVRYFDTYCTANLFGFPVLWVILQSTLWLVFCALCVYTAHRVFHRKGTVV